MLQERERSPNKVSPTASGPLCWGSALLSAGLNSHMSASVPQVLWLKAWTTTHNSLDFLEVSFQGRDFLHCTLIENLEIQVVVCG